VNTHRMKACECEQLKKYEDFSSDGVSIVEEMITERGHMCLFIPRFHCELNPIERCWCHANGSIVRLRKIVPEGLASVSTKLISGFFSHLQ
jgi:transposase